MIFLSNTRSRQFNLSLSRTAGFTLIELLVVLAIFLILTAIALPLTKTLLLSQKTTKTSQSIESFIDLARSRAIAEGRVVGVRFERLAATGAGRSASVLCRQLVGVPPYTGDASNAVATLTTTGTLVNQATFDAQDSPLLLLSSQLITAGNVEQAPIRPGDLLELPGGRTVPIITITGTGPVTITFNLLEPYNGYATFPSSGRAPVNAAGDQVKYRIHRSPVPSRSNVMSLPRGMAIDMNYSGVGLTGNLFAPDTAGTAAGAVDILFNADGAVSEVVLGGVRSFPSGPICFCVGAVNGVANIDSSGGAAEDAFEETRSFTANIMNLDSIWLVINPSSGRVSSVPIASVSGDVQTLRGLGTPPDFTDPNEASFGAIYSASRNFLTFSDTVDQ